VKSTSEPNSAGRRWLHALIWIPLTIAGAIVLLRPLKGLTIGIQYRVRAVDEPEQPGET
jgi:uncharacterized protein (DUF983 family)